jgi:protein required for attachment to host cells
MASERTWVLVADGSRARILQKREDGGRKQLRTIEGMTFAHDLPKTSEVVRDRLPRTFESVGNTRHAVATEVDPHREEKRKFASELVAALDAELVKKSFDRLVVVAPAQMLGDLRSALSPALRERTTADVVLDLTKVPDIEIASHLNNFII